MKPSMAARIRALSQMSVPELRTEYGKAFGEEPKSFNQVFLWRRVAWRIQEIEEGGLSERARQRAAELANDADLRVRAPRGAFKEVEEGSRTEVRPFHPSRGVVDPRLPIPGTLLVKEYRGQTLRVRVLEKGFEWEGRVYPKLTPLVKEITGTHWNGFLFFGLAGKTRPATAGAR